jgi:hypothetical protein
LLIFDLFHDWFDFDIPEYRHTDKAMSGHRNFFAVPKELVSRLPMKSAAAIPVTPSRAE